MKRTLSYIAGIISLAIGLIASTAFAATANGPYYATPSWDQTLPAETRFIVLSNMGSAAVLDRETGLVWEKVPSTSNFDWVNASTRCVQLNLGGRKGWRLPTIQDLQSLIDPTQSNPVLPSGHPFTVQLSQLSFYWSATSSAQNVNQAWLVHFGSGETFAGFKTVPSLFVWCVRGGQGVDPQ